MAWQLGQKRFAELRGLYSSSISRPDVRAVLPADRRAAMGELKGFANVVFPGA